MELQLIKQKGNNGQFRVYWTDLYSSRIQEQKARSTCVGRDGFTIQVFTACFVLFRQDDALPDLTGFINNFEVYIVRRQYTFVIVNFWLF